MENLKQYLQKEKSAISDSSVYTYSSILKSLFRKLNGKNFEDVKELISYFNKEPLSIISKLKDVRPNRRKTIFAALLLLCMNNPKVYNLYKNQMIIDSRQSHMELKEQNKTPKQKENWMSLNDINKKFEELYNTNYKLMNRKVLTKEQLHNIQDMVIMALYTLVPPRRLLDYSHFKIKNINKDVDNYMDKNKFYFNKYKTYSKYGLQEVSIPPKLKLIIDKWCKINPSDYIIMNERHPNTPLSQSGLSSRLNRIFGKNISVNQLRHIYITEKVLKGMDKLSKIDKETEEMGTSTKTAIEQYKKF